MDQKLTRSEDTKLQLARELCQYLNDLIKYDADAIHNLCEARVQCNDALLHAPLVQIATDEGPYPMVGLLGVLNGFIGVQSDGWGYVVAIYGKEGRVERFMLAATPEERAERRRNSQSDGGDST